MAHIYVSKCQFCWIFTVTGHTPDLSAKWASGNGLTFSKKHWLSAGHSLYFVAHKGTWIQCKYPSLAHVTQQGEFIRIWEPSPNMSKTVGECSLPVKGQSWLVILTNRERGFCKVLPNSLWKSILRDGGFQFSLDRKSENVSPSWEYEWVSPKDKPGMARV